jgi:hypothetical protein
MDLKKQNQHNGDESESAGVTVVHDPEHAFAIAAGTQAVESVAEAVQMKSPCQQRHEGHQNHADEDRACKRLEQEVRQHQD